MMGKSQNFLIPTITDATINIGVKGVDLPICTLDIRLVCEPTASLQFLGRVTGKCEEKSSLLYIGVLKGG